MPRRADRGAGAARSPLVGSWAITRPADADGKLLTIDCLDLGADGDAFVVSQVRIGFVMPVRRDTTYTIDRKSAASGTLAFSHAELGWLPSTFDYALADDGKTLTLHGAIGSTSVDPPALVRTTARCAATPP